MNGRLGRHLGSAEAAAVVNNTIGLVALVALVAATRGLPRAVARVRAGHRPRRWHLLGGLGGACFVAVSAAAAPEVGVALLTVALVCGQTGGSLGVDGAGLTPAGRRPPTPGRLAGVALAVGAVAVSAIGRTGNLHLGLLALAVGAGVATALQQAANGHLAQRTGEPLVAGAINFAVGLTALVVLAAAVTHGHVDAHGGVPVTELVGGLLGATLATGSAVLVTRLGVLELFLALTAGQSAGALVLDLVAPAAGHAVGVNTVAGVVLAFAAVTVSSVARLRAAA